VLSILIKSKWTTDFGLPSIMLRPKWTTGLGNALDFDKVEMDNTFERT
jgi:hypothetical protein